MRPVEVEILEDLLQDDITDVDLGVPIDLTRTAVEDTDDDNLGFRTLYENPEPVIHRPTRARYH
jgi:hypothetical protein